MKQRLEIVSDLEIAPVDALPDDDLMRLAALDRREAFETLVLRHQCMVFGLATRFLGNREQGRDVTQDVFLSLWAERHRYRPGGKFKSYLTSVCLNRCRVIVRGIGSSKRKETGLGHELAANPEAAANDMPLDALLVSEQRREIQAHLTQLPDKCRQVMIFRYTQGMSLAEISGQTDMPPGTVKSHLIRGIRRIRKMMKKEL